MAEDIKPIEEKVEEKNETNVMNGRKVVSIEITNSGVNVSWTKELKRIELIGGIEIAKNTINNYYEELEFRSKMSNQKIVKPEKSNFLGNLRGFLGKK